MKLRRTAKVLGMKKFLIIALFLTGCSGLDIQSAEFEDSKFWEKTFASEISYEMDESIRAMIVPSDLRVNEEINGFYAGLSIKPDLVVLMGVEDFAVEGETVLSCDDCIFQTTAGALMVDEEMVKKMKQDDLVEIMDEAFLQADSINVQTAFIREYLGEVPVLPLLFDRDFVGGQGHSEWLKENLPANSLIIISTNFVEYLPFEMAQFYDLAAYTTMKNLDVVSAANINSEAANVIAMMMGSLDGSGKVRRVAHKNSLDFELEHLEDTTSYLFMTFADGEKEEMRRVSTLAFGSLPGGHDLGLYKGWAWDKNYDEALDLGVEKMLIDFRGREDRALIGADFLAFDLIDNTCNFHEQNGMRVSYCKFVEGDKSFEEIEAEIFAENEKSDVVYLIYKYADDELNSAAKQTAGLLVNAGVDIFVAQGLKGIHPVSMYEGSLILYGLGDFIREGGLALEVNEDSEGVVVGISASDQYFDLSLFPVSVVNGVPMLMDFSKRPGFAFNLVKDLNAVDRDIKSSWVRLQR